ncbi:MAG: amidase family protein [Oscillospiraceae bacterium]|nr:amidase family protein [Oscillospiraceae bacterium]
MDCSACKNKADAETAVILEDCIMQKGMPAAYGSKISENFISPVNATVVTKLLKNDIEIAGRTAVNEFGIINLSGRGDEAETEAIKGILNDGAGFCLCNDIFGIYRRRAAENGLCYIHPTYGTVSRLGLMPAVSSMDQIGVLCRDLTSGFMILSLIAGADEGDGAMFPEKNYDYTATGKKPKLGLPMSLIDKADEKTRESVSDFAAGFDTVKIELEYLDICSRVMYILSCAEISNNISRYDGMKFGRRASGCRDTNEIYVKTRSECFAPDTKLTCITGCLVLSRDNYVPYYEKAMKLRRLIKESLRFDKYDLIVLPCEISENPYENLSLYSLANLAGLPSVSFSYKGRGIMLIANVKCENRLSAAWEARKHEI